MQNEWELRWASPDGLTLLAGWTRDGLTMQQIARRCGCTKKQLEAMKQQNADIARALSREKTLVDYEVEEALLRRACGYTYTEIVEDAKGGTKETTKEQPPDMSAMSFWLRNRQPKKWSDKPQADDQESLEKLDQLMSRIDSAAGEEGCP